MALAGLSLALASPARAQCRLAGALEAERPPGVPFDELVRLAEVADDAGRADEAVRAYRAALDLNPPWHDGWWRLGLLLSEGGCHEAARGAARRVVSLNPGAGPGWALLGRAELALGDREQAFAHLSRAIELGLASAPELGRHALHELTLLLIRRGDFPATARNLTILARIEPDEPELVLACGLAALRRPRLPGELTAPEREVVEAAGRAGLALLAGRSEEGHGLFEALLARYPAARGVHFAYGLVLSREGSPEALPLLRRETELFPDNGDAQLELAFETLERGAPAAALPPARAAVRLLPDSFWSHLALGRALLATEGLAEATVALETARRLAPEARDVFVALAQAYARAGRTAEVDATRATLQRLDASQQPSRR